MLRRILFTINLLRAMPAYCAVCLSGAKKLICAETEGYMWFLETYDGDRFFLRFAWLMWRYDCYRSHVVFRCSQASAMTSEMMRSLTFWAWIVVMPKRIAPIIVNNFLFIPRMV